MSNLESLRVWMSENGLDVLIIPSNDPHFSEYVADHWKTREWASGFTGSAGTAVITQQEAIVSVDSRYFLQAENQLELEWEVLRQKVNHFPEHIMWIEERIKAHNVIGIDGRLVSTGSLARTKKRFKKHEVQVMAVGDPARQIWLDRPPLPARDIFHLAEQFSGESAAQKLTRVRKEVDSPYLFTALDEIAWLLNLRGNDVECNPVFYSWLILEEDSGHLFCDTALNVAVSQHLKELNIEVRAYGALPDYLATLENIYGDNSQVPASVSSQVLLTFQLSPIPMLKALKNETEIDNIKSAMLKDGKALGEFYSWLKKQESPTEFECAQMLNVCRSNQGDHIGPSFGSIVGSRGNGAIIHYEPTEKSCSKIEPGMLLIDSGGQYLQGTTDITRTTCIGEATEEQKRHYTLVLKGVIGLSSAKFPKGIKGNQLEVLARQHLWQHGLNYGHGTGHGVGYLLNVHEGPQSFGTGATAKSVALEPGMLLTIEPGLYVPDSHGIRIENMVAVRESKAEGFLEFETLTIYPIDESLIDWGLMIEKEKEWFKAYNAWCNDKLN